MTVIKVERLGGLAGMGGERSRIVSRGEVQTSALPPAERERIDELFNHPPEMTADRVADGFSYKITREADGGEQTVVVSEKVVPPTLASSVRDEFR